MILLLKSMGKKPRFVLCQLCTQSAKDRGTGTYHLDLYHRDLYHTFLPMLDFMASDPSEAIRPTILFAF